MRIGVRHFDITAGEVVVFVLERALQHHRHLEPLVPVIGHCGPRRDKQQARRCILGRGQDRLFHAHTDGTPLNVIQIAAHIALQWAGQNGVGNRRHADFILRAACDQRQGCRQAALIHRHLVACALFQHRASDRLEPFEAGTAFVTQRHMGRDHQVERLGQGASGIAHEDTVRQMVVYVLFHHRIHFIAWRSRSSANLILDLIVPRGRPVCSAISLWDRSPKYAFSINSRCAAGNSAIA